MSPDHASARQWASSLAPDAPVADPQLRGSGTPHSADSEPPECASLAQILDTRNHRPMLRLQALQIIEGVCRSLDHTHRNGSAHGDIQPAKILVTAEGHVRLIDHGTTPTPAYASCEVLEGETPAAADDLFSAACTGYQLLAGEPAFGGRTALQAEAAGQRPVRIPNLSPGQWRALDRALAFRRAERQPDVETFLNELRSQYPGQAEVEATASVPALPIAHQAENRSLRRPVLAAGVAGIVVISIAVGWWWLRAPEVPASAAPTVSATGPGTGGLIIRDEESAPVTSVAPPSLTADTPTAPTTAPLSVPVARPDAASSPRPQAVPPGPAPAAVRAEPEPAATTGAAVSTKPDLPRAVVGPPRPVAPPTPLIAPRPVAPALPLPAAPAIALGATPAADTNRDVVPFSGLKLRHYVEPDYPRNRQGVRIAGWVDVRFGVDEAGRTTELQVTAAEPAGLFEDAALSAVRRWRFAPVEPPAGSDQKVRSEIRVRFTPD